MNSVIILGNMTRDPVVSYTQGNSMAVARFTLALNRGKDKDGNDRGADFPSVVCFGKTAELVERYCQKGKQVAVQGRIQTGSYEKNGQKIYTTDVVADRITLLGGPSQQDKAEEKPTNVPAADDVFSHVQLMDEDIPF